MVYRKSELFYSPKKYGINTGLSTLMWIIVKKDCEAFWRSFLAKTVVFY